MRSGHLAAIVCLSLLIAFCAFAKDSAAPSVSGAVVGTDGKPVKKAEVYLYRSDGFQGRQSSLIAKMKTDRKGTFAFGNPLDWTGLPMPAEYGNDSVSTIEYGVLVKHSKKGFGFTLFRKEHSSTDLRIVLHELRPVRLEVKDVAGKPLAGVKAFMEAVEAHKADKEGKARNQSYLAGIGQDIDLFPCVTDADGKITIDAPYGVNFRLVKEGYLPQESKGGKVILSRPCTVSGTVTLADGAPGAGCWIRARFRQDKQYWSDSTECDASGRYSIQVPGEAKGTSEPEIDVSILPGKGVTIFKKSLKFTAKGPGSTLQQDIALEKGVLISGTVTSLTDGKPVAGVALHTSFRGGGESEWGEVETDAEGKFSFSVPVGADVSLQWQTHSRKGDTLIDSKWIQQGNWSPFRGTVTKDKTLAIPVKLVPVRQAKAKVIGLDGKPVRNAAVYYHGDISAIQTDEAGECELKAVPQGEAMTLLASADGGALMGVAPLPADAPEATVQLQPTATRQCQARTPDGLPAGELQFYFQPMAGEQSINSLQQQYKTDKKGNFSAANVCPATRYKVFWSGWDGDKENRDYEWGEAIVDIPAFKAGETPTFPAPRYNCALMGKVVDKDGTPVENAKVMLGGTVVLNAEATSLTTDRRGEFVFSRLAQGEVSVTASAEGFKPARVLARSDGIDVVIVLAPGTEPVHNRVRVLGPDGKPVPKAVVFLFDAIRTEQGKETISKKRYTANDAGELDIVAPAAKEGVERRLCCDTPGYALMFADGEAGFDSETVIQLAKEGNPYKGLVTGEQGQPIAGAKVTLKSMVEKLGANSYRWKSIPKQHVLTAETDAQGAFVFPRLDQGCRFIFEVGAEGFCDAETRYDADPLKDSICLKRAGAISGKVIERATGKPLAGMLVRLGQNYEFRNLNATSGKDGCFTIQKVPAGEHMLTAGEPNPASKLMVAGSPAAVVEAGATANVTIEMEEGIPVTGRVTVKNPQAPGFQPKEVYVVKLGSTVARAPVGSDGTWTLHLPEGNFEIMTPNSKDMYQTKAIAVKRGEPSKEIVFEVD